MNDILSHRFIDDNGQVSFDMDGYIELLFLDKNTKHLTIKDKDNFDSFNRKMKFNSMKDEYKNNHLNEYRELSREEFDSIHQKWNIPEEYLNLDIRSYTLSFANNDTERDRLIHELDILESRNFLIVIKAIKYIVDVMIENDITYGVGRGSSVASYVLFKLKVHRIDSLKYDIDFSEFLE